MNRAMVCSFILFLLCSPVILRAQEGKLERVREEVNGTRESSSDKDKEKDRGDDCDSDDDDDDCRWSGELFLFLVTSPFTIPHAALGDDLNVYGYFPGFPYASGRPGYMHIGEPPPEPGTWLDGRKVRPCSFRLALEESNDFDGLNRVTGHLLLETSSRLGLQSSWTHLHECLCRGRSDELILGDVNFVFRFAQSERAQFRAGLGFRTLFDDSDSRWGFNFTYGADFYPAKPWILSTQIDAGTLGSAGVFHGRATAGFNWSRFEIYGGYDYLRIGSVNLQGPVVGVRLWF